MDKKLIIYRKNNLKGEDGYRTFSVRIKEVTVGSLDELATKSGYSRNEIINIILEFGIKQVYIKDK